jgi:hypothetical protein
MKLLIILLLLLIPQFMSCYNKPSETISDEIYGMLKSTPIWALSHSKDEIICLGDSYAKYSEAPKPALRQALNKYLNDAEDEHDFLGKFYNAEIFCGYIFELPPNHEIRTYFSEYDSSCKLIRPTTFYDQIVLGSPQPKSLIKIFFTEFDRLAASCKSSGEP